MRLLGSCYLFTIDMYNRVTVQMYEPINKWKVEF